VHAKPADIITQSTIMWWNGLEN